MSTASRSSSRCKLWTYCLLCNWLGCQLCSGGLKGCIFLCLLSWTLWCILWCCTGKLSPLNGDPEWGFWMGVLNGAIWGLNGGYMGQSYGADLGTIDLILISWSFWYLAHFPMTDSSLLNRAPVWGFWMGVLNRAVRGLNGGLYRVVIWGWSWYHWTCFIMLIILISGSFFYNWQFSFEWGSWMGILNEGSEWGHKRLEWGHTGWSYGTDLGTIELISPCQSFWYLAHFPMTNGSLLKGPPVQGCERPLNGAIWGFNGGHTGLILVPLNSSRCADCFDIWLVFLWPMVLFWMGILNGSSDWGHMRLEWGPYGVDLGTIELILSCWSFWYLAHFSMTDSSLLNGLVRGLTNGTCTVLCISSNTTLPWVTLLAAGEVWSAWLVMIFALGGGTPSLGQSLIKSNLHDVGSLASWRDSSDICRITVWSSCAWTICMCCMHCCFSSLKKHIFGKCLVFEQILHLYWLAGHLDLSYCL